MSVETTVDRARERVARERTWTAEKRTAIESFREVVADFETGLPVGGQAVGGPTTVATQSTTGGASVSAVLDAFEEHVGQYSGDHDDRTESVHAAVAEELSDEVAVSLCGGDSAGVLTPPLKQAILSTATKRLGELGVTVRALDREADSLSRAGETMDDVVDWLVEHNPTPLTDLGFDALRERHETLADHREALDALARRRQETVRSVTGGPEQVGIEHRVLIEYVYADAAADYPVLATAARFDDLCANAQRTVRRHLTLCG
ncbi:hypothetical protein GJ629_10290 [Halapricum sp. CBA1109]|uniref:DUF7260 family protein n=1 Tax=Halapricum sp. CBA1109 TaxID=2668068 RepID=UPI0012F734B1|nr:hypothetical protein [Halapricum sp. CBA1109]MUV90230.1 hypothetical protein [Halapricum sp. CBA1109]